MSSPSEIEKESLEAHVELCAIRYNNLEQKLTHLETRIDKLELYLVDIKKSLTESDKNNANKSFDIVKTVMAVLLAGLIGFVGSGLF